MTTYFLLLIIGFTGAFLQSNLGFGSALFMMNFLPLLVSSSQAFIVCQSTCIVLALAVLFKYHGNIRRDVLIPLLIPGVVFTIITTFLTVNLNTESIKVILGFCFIFLSLYFSFVAEKLKFKPSRKSAFIVGSISGIMNGAFSVGGPPAVLYLAPSIPEKEEYLGTSQAYFMCVNSFSLIVRLINEPIVSSDVINIISCICGALLGVFTGLRVGKKLNALLIKRLVYIVIGINGLLLIVKNI